jgi:hypothetical protein
VQCRELSFINPVYICVWHSITIKLKTQKSFSTSVSLTGKIFYRFFAPTEMVDVKLLTTYTLSAKTEENPQQFWDGLVYLDSRSCHTIFEDVKKGQPLSAVR